MARESGPCFMLSVRAPRGRTESTASNSPSVQRSDHPSETILRPARRRAVRPATDSRAVQDWDGLLMPPAPADGKPRLEPARSELILPFVCRPSTDVAPTCGVRSSIFLRCLRARLIRCERVLGEIPSWSAISLTEKPQYKRQRTHRIFGSSVSNASRHVMDCSIASDSSSRR